jgi:hypothetical protein
LSDPCPNQLDLDGSDATAHLEKRPASDLLRLQEVRDSARHPIQALAPESPRALFSLKICR